MSWPARHLRLCQALLYVAILAAWEILPRTGLVPRLFVPPLSEALTALVVDRHEYLGSLPTTFGEILASYAVVCGGGILLGQVVGSSARARRMLLPVLRSAYAVPLVVLYPVMMVWFGLGSPSKIAFASIYAFIPTMLTAVAGVAALSPALGETARAFGATRAQQILYIALPASLPSIVAALRLGGALVIVGVIVAQMLGAADGLGFLITRHRTLLNSPGVYAGIVLVLLITGMHEMLLRRLERRVAAYRQGA
ncbi:MAG TPA: ABC transporter permease [Methylomirabilota bacterium]|jgi:NitT/TauT family transport system permease protein/taurine transport system permease protein